MASLLRKRATINSFSIALIFSAFLDALSTVYAAHSAETWDVEANPVFRGLQRTVSGSLGPFGFLIAMKVVCVGVLILWLRLTLSRVSDLYPPLGRQDGFFQFSNFLFCGVDVRGWRSLFVFPRVSRLYRGLSVPVSVTAILGMFSASIVNVFHLLDGSGGALVFWVVVAMTGVCASLEMLRRDFRALCRDMGSQSGSHAA